MSDIPIVHALYDAYAAWHAALLKFPKSERYTLGGTVSKLLLSTLEETLGAAAITSPPEKTARLRKVSAKVDALKLLVRLAKECQCIPNNQYLDMESRLHETGKMLGGWMKSLG